MPQPKIQPSFLFGLLLLPNFSFLLPISHAKTVIEPCKSSDSCSSLLSYVLPWDSSLSDIAFRFQVNISSLLGSNLLDPTQPWPGNQILTKNSVVKVPVSCSCISGIRRAPVTYTIRAPDTLDSISDGFGGLVSGEQIRSFNSKVNGFIDGRKILVPLPCTCFGNTNNGLPYVYMSYVVQRGEGLSNIAAKYGTTVHELESVNELVQFNVDPGDILAIPLPACSSANLEWHNDTLILPNNTYALRANDCIVCSCGRNDLNLQCTTSGIGTSCSHLQCQESDLFIGQVSETPATSGCNVTSCVYRGYSGDNIFKSLVKYHIHQCPGVNQSGIVISPYLPWQRPNASSFSSCAPTSPSTVGLVSSTHQEHYSNRALLSYNRANFKLYLVILTCFGCQFFSLLSVI